LRGRLAAILIIAGAAVAVAALGLADRGSAPTAASSTEPVSEVSEDRIALTAADRERAAAVGLLPDNTRSVLKIDRPFRYGEFAWREQGVPQGPVSIVVDLRAQTLSVFRAGHEIGSTVVLYGADGFDTPLGEHPVLGKARDHHSRTYDAPMPFTLWLTDDGVGIHASDVRRGRATHGCIGVPPEFAEKLFETVEVGDPVRIVRSPEPQGATAAS
jgi:lipoprotein-anchoring transpeptidase ErfK/SrfK